MTSPMRGVTSAVLIASQLLAACTHWETVSVSPRALVDSAHVTAIQVTEKGGAEYVLNTPQMSGDSLRGRVNSSVRHVPLAAIDQVAVRKPHGAGTVALMLVVVVPLILAVPSIFTRIECGSGGPGC